MQPSLFILSAQGIESFSSEQRMRLEAVANVSFTPAAGRLADDQFVDLVRSAEYLGLTRRPLEIVGENVLEQLTRLRGISVYATGYEWLDLASLGRRGIQLSFLPDYSTTVVAEHAMAMILAMSRRLHVSHDRTRGIVPPTTSLRGFELRGRTLGILGMGKIGTRIAQHARAFGMTILFSDLRAIESETGVQVDTDRLWSESDILIVATSQTPKREAVIGREELKRMKPTAIVVNIARSSLVDNAAILEALRAKALRGYAVDDAVDVLTAATDLEPGRLLQTGHTAWYSDEAMARGTEEWVENMIAMASGHPRNLADLTNG